MERQTVVAKIGEMMKTEPRMDASELARVTQRTLLMFSDDDLVTIVSESVSTPDSRSSAQSAARN